MHVKKTTTVEVRFYGGGELEAGVMYEPADMGGIELDKSLIPKMPKGPLTVTVQKARIKEGKEGKPGAPILELALEDASDIKYTKDAPYAIRVEFPDNAEVREEVDKARKLYKADLDTVILVSLTQGTSESYKNVRSWVKEKPEGSGTETNAASTEDDAAVSGSGKKKAGRGRKAAKKKTGSTE